MHRSSSPLLPPPPPDPWLALVSPWAPPPDPGPPGPPAEADALAAARVDAARRIAAQLVDLSGSPVRVLATIRRGDEVEVVLSAAAAPPPGWSTAPGERLLVPPGVDTPTLVAAAPDALSDPAPALLELGDVSLDVVAVGVLTVPAEVATVSTVRGLLRSLLGAPASFGLDVLVSGLEAACLPPISPVSPGRLHAPIEGAALVTLARSLAGTEEPVVVVAPTTALSTSDLAALAQDGIGAVLVGDGPPDGWYVCVDAAGAPSAQRRRSAPDSRSAASAASS